ncbi:hypothetical protein [Streptomyces sp. Y7]|uniref:hypothetical protein n=1 Tax=Streptomyces sp. Y7 TaxID=3342392 RepID=UPI003715C54B
MADNGVERTEERNHTSEPWWAGLGTRGAVTLIVLGVLAAAWTVAAPAMGLGGLPLTPDNLATGVYQAAKVVAVGAVILVGAALTRRRAEAPAAPERD